MSVNDQFEYGRIPLKPLPYSRRSESQCNELMIDYGEDATYHIYIVHHADDTKYIDITNLIIKEMLPQADINADQFIITLEGATEPQYLMDILNFIYKRFTYAEDPSGFVASEDLEKVLDPTAKTVLLQTTDGTIQLPVTLASNVYDKDGRTIQERLDDMVRLGFGISYLYTTEQNQTTYEFNYPFEDYPDFMELRIGTVYIDKSRYAVTKHYDGEGHYTSGTITFVGESVENGRRIDILWLYNSAYNSNGALEFMSGSMITDMSIPTCKLEKTSNSYVYNDETSVATSKALHDMYLALIDAINGTTTTNKYYFVDKDTDDSTLIGISMDRDITNGDIYVISTSCDKIASCQLEIGVTLGSSGGAYMLEYPLKLASGKSLAKGIKANKTITVKIDKTNNIAYIIDGYVDELRTGRYIHDCVDQEYTISFSGLDYSNGDLIHVYRNGVRLFEDLDYSISYTDETITLYVRTEDGERIVFEYIGI